MKRYLLALMIFAGETLAGFHNHSHVESNEKTYEIGMEESSLAYLRGDSKPLFKMPDRPFTISELMGDPDMNQYDLLVVPYAEGAKMVPAGQILSVLNQVEAASNRAGRTIKKCDKKSLLMVFIKNRNRNSRWWFPGCREEMP